MIFIINAEYIITRRSISSRTNITVCTWLASRLVCNFDLINDSHHMIPLHVAVDWACNNEANSHYKEPKSSKNVDERNLKAAEQF